MLEKVEQAGGEKTKEKTFVFMKKLTGRWEPVALVKEMDLLGAAINIGKEEIFIHHTGRGTTEAYFTLIPALQDEKLVLLPELSLVKDEKPE